jgi:hypothetical protein
MGRKPIIKGSVALILLSIFSIPILTSVAHRSGKRLGIGSWIKRAIARFESPPDGYPVTVHTRSGEKVYFDVVHLDLVDSWDPEESRPKEFRLETDTAGQLSVTNTLETVTALQVLKLPPFSKEPADKVEPRTPTADLVSPNPYQHREIKKERPQYTPLLCRLKLTFESGKVLEGKVTVHHEEFENRVWGTTPEGPRHMALSHIASITIDKRRER